MQNKGIISAMAWVSKGFAKSKPK